MEVEDHIVHQGFVTSIKDHLAHIKLFDRAECDSCHIKEFCGATDESRTEFDVPDDGLKVGDEVILDLKPSTGLKAMFWAYIFPFLLILTVLVIGRTLGVPDKWNGIVAIVVLFPYFFGLSKFKSYLQSQLEIRVRKT